MKEYLQTKLALIFTQGIKSHANFEPSIGS